MGNKEEDQPWFKKKLVYPIDEGDTISKQTVTYWKGEDTQLEANIFSLSDFHSDKKVPVVIFVMGFSDSGFISSIGMPLKDVEQYRDWANLIATQGLMAITYQTFDPVNDIERLMIFIQENCDEYNIDTNRIGLWSCSGNVPLAQYILHQTYGRFVKCAVFYYGVMYSTKLAKSISELSKIIGFVNPFTNETHGTISNVSLFVVRAGLETIPNLNNSIENFINLAIDNNINIDFVNYPDGHHAFDIIDDTPKSRDIINQTLMFFESNLL